MKILVTGGAGFIGSHVADGFIENGHDVIIIDNLSTGKKENIPDKARFFLMDIGSAECIDLFREEKIDAVCHHAAQMDVRRSVEDPLFDANTNIIGTLNLLQASRQCKVKHFLFASTGGAVYGEQETFPCDETHPTRPISPYGVSKLAVENYLFYYHTEFEMPCVILRYANVYGPRQNPLGEAGVIAIFTDRLLRGEQPCINGDGKQTRDYVFVKDVVRANLKALSFEQSDTFNVGTGVETDVNTLFKMLNRMTGDRASEHHEDARKGEQRRSVIDYTKINSSLGWKPLIDLEKGLSLTVDYFRSCL